jgi:anti-anti-sigma factor
MAGAGHEPELAVAHLRDGISVLVVRCELDMQTAPSFKQLLVQELSGGCRALIVDLSECEFLGSSGLTALVEARDRADSTSTRVALAGMSRITSRALEATGLDSLFAIHPSVAGAVSTLGTVARVDPDGSRTPRG